MSGFCVNINTVIFVVIGMVYLQPKCISVIFCILDLSLHIFGNLECN